MKIPWTYVILAFALLIAGAFMDRGFLSCTGQLNKPQIVQGKPETSTIQPPKPTDSATVYMEAYEAGLQAAKPRIKWLVVSDTLTVPDPEMLLQLQQAYAVLDSMMQRAGIDLVTREILRGNCGLVKLEHHTLGMNFRGTEFIDSCTQVTYQQPPAEPKKWFHVQLGIGPSASYYDKKAVVMPSFNLNLVGINLFSY